MFFCSGEKKPARGGLGDPVLRSLFVVRYLGAKSPGQRTSIFGPTHKKSGPNWPV
jgi:hypothetical protein